MLAKRQISKLFTAPFILFIFFALSSFSPAFANSTFSIYSDQLDNGFANWSWGSSLDFGITSPVASGSHSLGFYPTPYGGLYLHSDAVIDTSVYSSLTFELNTKYSNQKFKVIAYDGNNNALPAVSLDNYGGDPPINSWKTYTIPLSDLQASNKQIKGIALQNNANYPELVYVDNVALTGSSVLPTPIVTQAPAPTSSPAANSPVISAANDAYNNWKSKYVQSLGGGVARVVRPENNNDTVSEGIGYGMLLSVFANDESTFSSLWNYGKKYLDSKGLMNWQIASSGSVIGQGSATDADEDMAYALLRAEQKWSSNGYGNAAKNLINAMLSTEVQASNLINPGDNWGATQIINPSYLAPAYYRAFASFTGDSRWATIANANLSWEQSASNTNTGLVPDWLNANFSQPSISWDQYPNGFFYDAVRAPIRLLMDYKWNNSSIAGTILSKENNFISGIGLANLKSGYSLSGNPLTSYIDSTFLGGYAAMSQISPSSPFASDMVNALIQNNPTGYFGTSIRALSLYVIAGAN